MRTLKELNKKKMYTKDQLQRLKKFENKFINVYPHHHEYWVDGKGYETVYEIRGISNTIRENYQTVTELFEPTYRKWY